MSQVVNVENKFRNHWKVKDVLLLWLYHILCVVTWDTNMYFIFCYLFSIIRNKYKIVKIDKKDNLKIFSDSSPVDPCSKQERSLFLMNFRLVNKAVEGHSCFFNQMCIILHLFKSLFFFFCMSVVYRLKWRALVNIVYRWLCGCASLLQTIIEERCILLYSCYVRETLEEWQITHNIPNSCVFILLHLFVIAIILLNAAFSA